MRGEQAVRDAGLGREGALGRHREKEKRRMGRPGKRRKMGPLERWVRAGLPEVGPGMGFGFLVLGLGWVSFLLLLLFLFLFKLTQSNLFEFKKKNLNPTLTLKQINQSSSMNATTIN